MTDIVNHCVNDMSISCRCLSIILLKIILRVKILVDKATDFVKGCSEACKSVGCVLRRETAEMPLVYNKGHFDVRNF